MKQFSVTITDDQWPYVKIIVNRDGNVRTERAYWDIAAAKFEPLVRDALAFSVQELIKRRKG